jgi:pyruvate,orthophosphate dikinase
MTARKRSAARGKKTQAVGRKSAKKAAGKSAKKSAKKKATKKKSSKKRTSKASTPKSKTSVSAGRRSKSAATHRRVFFFGSGNADGRAGMKEILGGKGANLAEMTSIGIPVPPGFTISTDVCAEFNNRGQKLPPVV